MPRSKLGEVGWSTVYAGGISGNAWFFYPAGNIFQISSPSNAGVFSPEDAWNIDTKTDDGLPGKGKVVTYKNTTGNCTTTTNIVPPGDAASTYALTYKSKECLALYWVNAY